MEQIAVIANNKEYAAYLANDLRIYFGEQANFIYYGTEEIEKLERISETCIVISAFTIFQQVKKKMHPEAQLVIADLTLSKVQLDGLYKLPKGTRALLVNIDYRSCMEVITLLYHAGFKDLELLPFYAGAEYDTSVTVAITPGELNLVPKGISTVMDIGQRVVDISCILELADKLGVEDPFRSKGAYWAKQKMIPGNLGMEIVLGEQESLVERIKVLIKLVQHGILITDMKGKIYLANDMAQKMLRSRTELISGFNIAEILPELVTVSNMPAEGGNGELINVNGVNLIASVAPIISHGMIQGNVVLLDNFTELEDRQHRMRSKITGYGHKASYTFSDILGESAAIKKTKEIAKRMAHSESSVVLYGESGTGKELFAQSIHNASLRRNYLFVAVNCSALPENLLESELYGYEEGAFSGAKKGGKIGLFEMAHGGTLFLDEIGELPLSLQAKLLRVIEERKILKVGGKDLIQIDVRIITATNRNLMEMVKEKKFRSDLYYRLNVLPVQVPSLRERKEDISLLFSSFAKKASGQFTLSAEAKARMLAHPWPGNIRELKNTVEYLENLDKTLIEAQDLPFYEEEQKETKRANFEETGELAQSPLILQFMQNEGHHGERYEFLLEQLQEAYDRRERMGRRALAEKALAKDIFVTEQEIKNGLAKLSAYGMVESGRGRSGSTITMLGRGLLTQLLKLRKR